MTERNLSNNDTVESKVNNLNPLETSWTFVGALPALNFKSEKKNDLVALDVLDINLEATSVVDIIEEE